MNIQNLRTMREEMESIISLCERVTLAQIERWGITLDAYLATTRCPKCGTSVEPKLHVMPEDGPCHTYDCVACWHTSKLHDTEQDALKAFYGEGE